VTTTPEPLSGAQEPQGPTWARASVVEGPDADGALRVSYAVRPGDLPGAVALGTTAPRAVLALQHLPTLPDLGGGELFTLLSDVARLVSVGSALQDEITYQARTAGLSWESLGNALGVERSTARERFQRIARDRGARVPDPLRDGEPRPGWVRAIHSAILDRIEKASTCPFCQHSGASEDCSCIAADCACSGD
jgi:hypothetical protein